MRNDYCVQKGLLLVVPTVQLPRRRACPSIPTAAPLRAISASWQLPAGNGDQAMAK